MLTESQLKTLCHKRIQISKLNESIGAIMIIHAKLCYLVVVEK